MKTLNEKLKNDLNKKNSLIEVLNAKSILLNNNMDKDSRMMNQEKGNSQENEG